MSYIKELEELGFRANRQQLIDLLDKHARYKRAAVDAIIRGAREDCARDARDQEDLFKQTEKEKVLAAFDPETGLFTFPEEIRPDELTTTFNGLNRPDVRETAAYKNSPGIRAILDQGAAQVATMKEIVDWLEGYMRNGGKIYSIFLAPKLSDNPFYVIAKNIDVPPFQEGQEGRHHVDIIVPKGVSANVKLDYRGRGQHNLYRMDDYPKSAFVYVYAEMLEEMKNRPFFQGAIGKLEKAFRLKEQEKLASRDDDYKKSTRLSFKINALIEEFNRSFETPPAAPKGVVRRRLGL